MIYVLSAFLSPEAFLPSEESPEGFAKSPPDDSLQLHQP
jgi:hypothetical protein